MSPKSTSGVETRVASLSVVLPAHNEELIIERTVSSILDFVPQVADTFEVIVVDDGSTDGTGSILAAMAARDARVVVVTHPRNLGYGAALRSGFARARHGHVFYTDSDGQFDIRELPLLLPHVHEVDIVTGYRRDRQDPANRKLNAGILRIFNRVVLGLKLRDVDCAFKVYKKEVLDSIDLLCDGILIDTEIFYKAKRQGYTLKEVPVTHFPREGGAATGNRPDVLVRVVRELPNLLKSRGRRRAGAREPKEAQ